MYAASPARYSTLPYHRRRPRPDAPGGRTRAEMALAWILRDGKVTSVLIGASKPRQILDNIAALNNTAFTADELEAIDRASG